MSVERDRLTGWGRTAPTTAAVVRPTSRTEAITMLSDGLHGRAVGFRGLGRSYGDAAQSAGGTVVETTRMAAVLNFDRERGTVRAEAGLSIDALLRRTMPEGWFIPVTPGTRMVTLGGAVASDVHGKNHHRDGSFGVHVSSLRLVLPGGSVRDLVPGDPLFGATVGGMGLTGFILEMTVQLLPVTSSFMKVKTVRAGNLESLMRTLEDHDTKYRYSVAWIDCLSGGHSLGRGVVTSGDHAATGPAPGGGATLVSTFDPKVRLRAPSALPPGLLNRASVRVFNEAWYRHAPRTARTGVEHAATFFHPLDGVADWNRIYGPRGFVQYQYVVPFGREDTVARSLRLLSDAGAASFLAVLKRFGEHSSGLMSFPRPGWTLALDLPVRAGLADLLAKLDRLVLEAGGRLYLAKDSRMPRPMLEAGYPNLEEFRKIRRSIDPDRRLVTDLARRLDL